jgi:3-deoxy-D-manno-octulosonic-acid transferase
MVLWFYRLVFLPVMLIVAPYYLWRMRRRGGYGEGFENRFGRLTALPSKREGVRRIWLQAVSVGELLAIGPLLDALQKQPDLEVYLTTTTSTGYRLAKERYVGRVLAVGYFPMDFWSFSARAWKKICPDLALLAEGERWPEHIHQAHIRGVPVICINARLSDRSYGRMRRVRGLVPGLLGGITRFLAVSAEDAARFEALGVAPERVKVAGNLKVDTAISEMTAEEKTALRTELGFGEDDQVLLGSSTWAGEEQALVDIWRRLRERTGSAKAVKLLLVPRHAERRAELESIAQIGGRDWVYHLRSCGPGPAQVDLAIGDTTGELQRLTQIADVVFVGKSLPPHREGQTPLEAAGLGKPIVFGSGMGSFRSIAQDLVTAGAALRVADVVELESVLKSLLADEICQKTMGEAGLEWHRGNKGTLDRTIAEINSILISC